MRIIISPAKKMNIDTDTFEYNRLPQFIKETEILLSNLHRLSYEEAKFMWSCNDQIAELNYERLKKMDLYRCLTPAIFSYEGIQYQYMAPGVFQMEELQYLEEHVRILSGFYGLLRPFDGVVPYRLEMQAKLHGNDFHSLYEFWNERLAEQLISDFILEDKDGKKISLSDFRGRKVILFFYPNNHQDGTIFKNTGINAIQMICEMFITI